LQHNAFGSQVRSQIRKPRVAISQHDSDGAFQQHGHDFSIRLIGWSQEDASQQSRATQLCVQPKTIKGLSIRMIFAIPRLASKADAPRDTSKSTHRNGQVGIIPDDVITQPTPQAFFDGPQIGGLTNKCGQMYLCQRREKVWIVLPKRVKQLLILGANPGNFPPVPS